MEHSFDTRIAKELGVYCAILYNNIKFWCAKNRANNKHFYNGQYWTYNSKKAFLELFPYLTYSQIKSSLSKLEEAGYIGKGEFNDNPYDRTKWYCDLRCEKQEITSGEIRPLDRSNISNRVVSNDHCITDINTDKKPNINTPDGVGVCDSLFPDLKQPKKQKEKKEGRATFFSSAEFRDSLIAEGADEQDVLDFMAVRKKKKAVDTLTAYNRFIAEVSKAGLSVKDAVKMCAGRSWSGFEAKWLGESTQKTAKEDQGKMNLNF